MSELFREPLIHQSIVGNSRQRAIAIHLTGRLIMLLSKWRIQSWKTIGMKDAHIHAIKHFPDIKLNHEK